MFWVRDKKNNFPVRTFIRRGPDENLAFLWMGGHIVFGVDPIGLSICLPFHALSSEQVDRSWPNLHRYIVGREGMS